ncbi:ABC transporter substrate-binding protein [Paenibacillus sp. ACRRX]|uniref:ABC transporter substrate-binding protein n=1 Tax=Paenibacillus sp. ACRRX TaxID=2918206 RepID=UPI001EF47366|nr:ABC transporter substrate-binding protein [Paenibacillus sp. ACRRX]MCG7407324.1 ABC transporter substrate-binding protein [Paenibacillus sp. ACRRX]
MWRKKTIAMMMVAITVLFSVGCASSSENSSEGRLATPLNDNQEVVQQSEATFPKTITHLSGETVIAHRPIKIATPYIAFVDYLAVLDVYPVAGQGIGTINQNFPNLSKLLQGKEIIDLGMEVSMEKLLAANPDLIIAADDMIDKYDQLQQIAPTVILPQAGNWRETLIQLADMIGREGKAESVLAAFDKKSAAYKAKLAERGHETVLFAMYSGKEQFITWEWERFEPFYNGLGLKPVPGTEKGGPLTLEGLAVLNPNHIFVINNWQNPIQGGVSKALKDNEVWRSMEAVKKDQVYYLEDPSLPGPMALAKINGIEDIIQAMGH